MLQDGPFVLNSDVVASLVANSESEGETAFVAFQKCSNSSFSIGTPESLPAVPYINIEETHTLGILSMSYPIESKAEVKSTDGTAPAKPANVDLVWLGKIAPSVIFSDNGTAYASVVYSQAIRPIIFRA